MAAIRDSLLSDRPLGWPAWCVSLVVHLCVLAAVFIGFRPLSAESVSDEPIREVGIVLKHQTDNGPMFESEENLPNQEQASTAPTPLGNPTLAALPNQAEFPSSSTALPQLSSLPADTFQQSQPGQVSQMASGSAPSKNVGSKTTTSVFGISGTGTRFVYVFDRSISMAGSPLRAAKQQLIASLQPLESVHQFQVIFFNHEPQAWDLTGGQSRIAFATDANKRMAEKFIRNVAATGGTFRHTALQLALRLRPDVIFFLTDTDDPMSGRDLSQAIHRAQRDSIAINTIEYGSGSATNKNDNFLVQLARETHGQYVYVNTRQLAR